MTAVRRTLLLLALPCLAFLASCSSGHHSAAGTVAPPPPPPAGLALQTVKTGLNYPVYLVSPPADTARLFIVEEGGRIRIIKSGVLLPTPFLDVSSLVSTGGEQGLLSMAFPPDYAASGRF